MYIEGMVSERINLINCDKNLLKAILAGDEYLAKMLKVKVPSQWSEFGQDIFDYTLEIIKTKPEEAIWYLYLPIETRTQTVLGSCGYKGAPDANGMVEIGYEVAKKFRNQGLATEMTQLLINIAFASSQVKVIQAHTLTERNASVRVLEKCNFKFVEEYLDEGEMTWKWMLSNNTSKK